jgi:hypothetical protein
MSIGGGNGGACWLTTGAFVIGGALVAGGRTGERGALTFGFT